MIQGIERMDSDSVQDFSPKDSYYQSQEMALRTFFQEYALLAHASPTGKPVMEGFYRLFKEKSHRYSIPPEDFVHSFGKELLEKFERHIP